MGNFRVVIRCVNDPNPYVLFACECGEYIKLSRENSPLLALGMPVEYYTAKLNSIHPCTARVKDEQYENAIEFFLLGLRDRWFTPKQIRANLLKRGVNITMDQTIYYLKRVYAKHADYIQKNDRDHYKGSIKNSYDG